MKLTPKQQATQREVRELASQFVKSEDPKLIVEMRRLLKVGQLSLNKAGIQADHLQKVKACWDLVST